MASFPVYFSCILLYLHCRLVNCLSSDHGNIRATKLLNVGEELQHETLPLQMGHRLYQLCGLKESYWYEVKISYPASIPTSFSIQLVRNKSDYHLDMKRRLLNTEKLIFKARNTNLNSRCSDVHVLVSAKPEGVVAKPYVKERELVIFNIVCDELSYGIPHKAWWVGILALICILFAFVAPYFLPTYLLPKVQSSELSNLASSKSF